MDPCQAIGGQAVTVLKFPDGSDGLFPIVTGDVVHVAHIFQLELHVFNIVALHPFHYHIFGRIVAIEQG